jgi:hypothetical protein
MARKFLLALKEKPSFAGELSLRLFEERDSEGRTKYSLLCQKKPSFNEKEVAIFFGVLNGSVPDNLHEITKTIDWQREVPTLEATELMETLEHQVLPLIPETIEGLDGTTYELLIERGSSKVQFSWWCEPPRVWKALGKVAMTLLNRADAATMADALQSETRKQLIRQLAVKLGELQADMKKESEELMRTHNRRCHELAKTLSAIGLTCPGCGRHSNDVRFIDKSPDAKSYFICGSCGRSFRAEDLQPVRV